MRHTAGNATGLVYGAPVVASVVFSQLLGGAATRARVDGGHVCVPHLAAVVSRVVTPGAERDVRDGQAIANGRKALPRKPLVQRHQDATVTRPGKHVCICADQSSA